MPEVRKKIRVMTGQRKGKRRVWKWRWKRIRTPAKANRSVKKA